MQLDSSTYISEFDDLTFDRLAPREREVAILTLRGLTSAQVAEQLGISASTVRTTLHRVYEKYGVYSSVELSSLLVSMCEERADGTKVVEEDSSVVEGGRLSTPNSVLLSCLASSSLISIFLSETLPASTQLSSMMLEILALLLGANVSSSLFGLLLDFESRVHQHFGRKGIISLFVRLCFVLLFFLSCILIWTLRYQTQGIKLVVMLFSYAFASVIVTKFGLDALRYIWKSSSFSPVLIAILCCVIALFSALIQNRHFCFAVYCVSVSLISVCLLIEKHDRFSSNQDCRTFSLHLSLRRMSCYLKIASPMLYLIVFSTSMLAFQYLRTFDNSVLLIILPVVFVSLMSLVRCRSYVSNRQLGIFLALFLSIAFIPACFSRSVRVCFLLLVICAAAILMASFDFEYETSATSFIQQVILCCTAGYIIACFILYLIMLSSGAGNKFDDYSHGYSTSLLLALVWDVVTILEFHRETQRLLLKQEAQRLSDELDSGNLFDLIRAYFVSKGLSTLQIDVMMDTLRGQTSREIARSLNYSTSAIKAARRSAYEQLGIKGMEGFEQLFERLSSL